MPPLSHHDGVAVPSAVAVADVEMNWNVNDRDVLGIAVDALACSPCSTVYLLMHHDQVNAVTEVDVREHDETYLLEREADDYDIALDFHLIPVAMH